MGACPGRWGRAVLGQWSHRTSRNQALPRRGVWIPDLSLLGPVLRPHRLDWPWDLRKGTGKEDGRGVPDVPRPRHCLGHKTLAKLPKQPFLGALTCRMGMKSPTASCTEFLASSMEMPWESQKGTRKGRFCWCSEPRTPGGLPAGSHTAQSPEEGRVRSFIPWTTPTLSVKAHSVAAAPSMERKAGFLTGRCCPRAVHKARKGQTKGH